MKEMIDKLSAGMIDYEEPVLHVDVDKLQFSMQPEEQKEGSFFVENIGGGKLKGIIYSNSEHMIVKTKMFGNGRTMIRYQAEVGKGRKQGTITGSLCLVSNGGEWYLPFEITIQNKSMTSSMGEIRDVFQFANLAQKEYDEALRMFCSHKFPEIVLAGEDALRAKYTALIQCVDKKIAMDQFLIAANKKKAVCLRVDLTERYYEAPLENIQDTIEIQKESWGYIGGRLVAEGDFIELEKNTLESGDFHGTVCRLPYVIRADKLREGNNYGWIVLTYMQDTIRIPFRVYKMHRDGKTMKEGNTYGYKKNLAKLYHCYLDFRMKKINRQEWASESLRYVTELRKFTADDTMYALFQVMIMMAQGKEIETKLIFAEIGKKMDASYEKDRLEYAFYLYLKALREKNPQETRKSMEQIREFYQNGHQSWQLLWMLFYLDENYMRNESLKILRMKEQYDRGMRSPLMYYESMAVFQESPSLLRVLDDFERDVLAFGMKYDFMDAKVLWRLMELCSSDKVFRKEHYRLLEKAYQRTGDEAILTEIISMLIKGGKTGECYFKWYELGVRKDLKLTGLYEYFMYAMSFQYHGEIPEVIYMYFVYNLNLKGEKLDFLYQKVIEDKERLPKIYRVYEPILEKYALESMKQGRINDKLSVVYEEMLPGLLKKGAYSKHLPELLQTYLIQCENKSIREVILIYREMEMEEHVPLIDGKAYLPIYSSGAVMVFGDMQGNRYLQSVHYQKKKLLNLDSYMSLCYERQPEHPGILLYLKDGSEYQKYRDKVSAIMEQLLKMEDLREEYRIELEMQLLEYRARYSSAEEWKKSFQEMEQSTLTPVVHGVMMEQAVERGMEKEAYEMLCKYGASDINDWCLFKIVNRRLQKMQEENWEEDEALVGFALESYRRKKYNEKILQYLGDFYYGPTKEMYELWHSIRNFGCESLMLEEKLVVQMLFTGEYANHIGGIFASYLKHGGKEKVKRAYLIKKSYDAFVRETVIDQRVLQQIETEIFRNQRLHYLCELAWLKAKAEEETLSVMQQKKCREIVEHLYEEGKIFEFYKKFQSYFALPEGMENKTIIEYRSIPYGEVTLFLMTEEGEYRQIRMQHVGHGIYICPLILFYGETVKYYIRELHEEQVKITESMEVSLGREHSWENERIYGMMNNAFICMEMGEDTTLVEMAEQLKRQSLLHQKLLKV